MPLAGIIAAYRGSSAIATIYRETTLVFNQDPSTVGWGAAANGGGRLAPDVDAAQLTVTNLNDTGTGSLRAALNTLGKRYITVQPGLIGTIQLASRIQVLNGQFTFDGSAGNLLVRGHSTDGAAIQIECDDFIVRHLRVGKGDVSTLTSGADSFSLVNANDGIVDHCSFFWGVDGVCDVAGGCDRITVSNCLIAHGLSLQGHSKLIRHSTGTLAYGDQVTFYRNLWMHCEDRSPQLPLTQQYEVINCVVANWTIHGIYIGTSDSPESPLVDIIGSIVVQTTDVTPYINPGQWFPISLRDDATPTIYVSDNWGKNLTSTPPLRWPPGSGGGDDWDLVGLGGVASPGADVGMRSLTRVAASPVQPPTLAAVDLWASLAPDVGCRPDARMSYEQALIDDATIMIERNLGNPTYGIIDGIKTSLLGGTEFLGYWPMPGGIDEVAVLTTEVGEGTAGEGVAVTLPVPVGGILQNDIVVVLVASDLGSATPPTVTTAGYSAIATWTGEAAGLYYKRMGASPDSSATITRTGTAEGNRVGVIIQVLRGVNVSQAIDAQGTPATGTTGTPTPPSVTTTMAPTRIYVYGVLDDDKVAASVTFPIDYTDRIATETSGTAGNACTLMVASKALGTIGTETPGAFGVGDDANWAMTVAWRGTTSSSLFAPTNTVLPTMSPTSPGVGVTVTAANGTWTGNPAPTFTYQWLRNGANISAATAQTYVVTTADRDAAQPSLAVRVTATNSQGSTAATSAEISIPAAPIELEPINLGLTRVELTVGTSAQQTFEGFGWSASEEDNPAINVAAGDQATVYQWIYEDLHLRAIRLWGGPGTYTPAQMAGFYVTSGSGLIATAQARGVTAIISAHSLYNAGDPTGTATTITQFWNDCFDLGIPWTHCGGPNEPGTGGVDDIPNSEIPTFANALRSGLNGHGLSAVKLFGPDYASHDNTYDNYYDVMSAAGALGVLDHLAGHTYEMGANQEALTRQAASGLWELQTESGSGGVPQTGARILNDLNHGCAMWFVFLATGSQVDGSQKLVWIDGAGAPSRQPYYWLMRQASDAFLPGTVIRHVTSDLSAADGGTHMEWTYADWAGLGVRKPKIHGAAGMRTDGKWALGSINGTHDAGSTAQGGAYWPGETIQVTMTVPSLSAFTGVVPTVRTGPVTGNLVAGSANMVNGVVRFTLPEQELLTIEVG